MPKETDLSFPTVLLLQNTQPTQKPIQINSGGVVQINFGDTLTISFETPADAPPVLGSFNWQTLTPFDLLILQGVSETQPVKQNGQKVNVRTFAYGFSSDQEPASFGRRVILRFMYIDLITPYASPDYAEALLIFEITVDVPGIESK